MIQDRKVKVDTPVQKEIFRRAEDSFKAGMFLPTQPVTTTHFFGKDTTEQVQATKEDLTTASGAPNKELRDAQELNYSRYLSKMRQFFKDKPQATDEEAQIYSQGLMKPHAVEAVNQALTGNTPADQPWTFKTEADAKEASNDGIIKSGERVVVDGKSGLWK